MAIKKTAGSAAEHKKHAVESINAAVITLSTSRAKEKAPPALTVPS